MTFNIFYLELLLAPLRVKKRIENFKKALTTVEKYNNCTIKRILILNI